MDIEENTSEDTQEEQPVQLDKKWEFKTIPVIIILIALVGLIFIIWLIFSIWALPSEPASPLPTATDTESVEAPEFDDPTVVPGRNPDVLGLRIDAVIGTLFTDRNTNKTLYVTDLECTGACLDDWTPYLADPSEQATVTEGGKLDVLLREDSDEFQYTWKGQWLYTYNLDGRDSVLGDGHSNAWFIARP